MELQRVSLDKGADLIGFRKAVRGLVARKVPPDGVIWNAGGETDFFGTVIDEDAPPISLSRALGTMVDQVICHRDPQRYAMLYRLIWRVLQGERALLDIASDPLVHALEMMRKSVRRDLHKMHAFLRFRQTADPDGAERYVAWFEPDDYIVEATSNFFIERYRGLRWSILTPVGSLHWDREKLVIGPPGQRSDAPESDAFEAAWRSYYESTFNPARVNTKMMRTEMPKKYWLNLPETQAIPDLVRSAPARVREMIARGAAMPVKRNPDRAVAAMAQQEPQSLAELNNLIAASEPLVPGADHAVLGEGPEGAAICFVGEQPGDQEDIEGHPFVGPAGQVLLGELTALGIDRGDVYLTNAVKHFKFEQRGKRRIHRSPSTGEVKHYRWWLMKELSFVRPRLVVALGATAALALTGKPVSVTKARGERLLGDWPGYVTVHPAYLLRLPDEAAKQQALMDFRADLEKIKALAA